MVPRPRNARTIGGTSSPAEAEPDPWTGQLSIWKVILDVDRMWLMILIYLDDPLKFKRI